MSSPIQYQPIQVPYAQLPGEGQQAPARRSVANQQAPAGQQQAQNQQQGPGNGKTVDGVWIRDTWEGHNQYIADHIAPAVIETLSVRKLDCIRQVCGSVFCGFACLPCATIRLTGHVTGCYDPMKCNCCGSERAIPGLELCSAPDCSQICGDPRGYGHKDYTRPQDGGSGLSRRNADILNCFGAAACALLVVFGGAK